MCYDDMLRKIYTATSQNQLENCLDELYTMCYVNEDITEAEKDILCDIAQEQGNRLFMRIGNTENYTKLEQRFIDDANEIVTVSELKSIYDGMNDMEKAMYYSLDGYLKACMYWDNGILTPII